ncbi:acetoin dehydrogenase E2 subunit dihydrolipoyllysine-residue acetyltransferase [Roseibium album]|nr:acetoin dehydrogenase E2 subunit dihydrolipoyllysine-residue acetyltransferase [Roseibium album]
MQAVAFLAIFLFFPSAAVAENPGQEPIRVMLSIRGVIERPALWFDAGAEKAVVLLHQYGVTSQSWTPFAELLHSEKISSIAPSGSSGEDALAAVEFLEEKGVKNITLIGASMGGGAAQQAASKVEPDQLDGVILLGTATGAALSSPDYPKLFIHARDDFFMGRSVESYNKAADPKTLVELPGAKHAQELLEGEQQHFLQQMILGFIRD